MILEKEYILSLNEYCTDRLAITCERQETIFNIVKGSKKERVADNDGLNAHKTFIQKIEGFSKEFPFLLVTGNSQIQLVNVETNQAQLLISRSNQTDFG